MLKYTRIVHVSNIVVIRGAAMIAGSSPIFFATRGRMHPIHFAIATTAIMVTPRAAASMIFLSYIIQIRTPLTTARRDPTISATLISLNITLNMSENSISPTASPRMISVELWEPQFPPVPMSIGINVIRTGIAAIAFS